MRNESFARLLKAGINSAAYYEGRTAPTIEHDLGQQIGVAGTTIQRYKAGYVPPEARTIRILAELAVKRGHQNKAWLNEFLHAAGYPDPLSVIDDLYPEHARRDYQAGVFHNIPAPSYGKFIARTAAYAEVVDGLQQRSPVVLITGLGGMGKTSLAREVALGGLHGDLDGLAFAGVVWISDKDSPGTTNFATVLDDIARTLDYPSFTTYEFDEKRRAVEQLVRRERLLLVVDNFETITDGALLTWLLRLPEPSKALVTSREYSRAFRNNTFVVDLRGMDTGEAQEMICYRLQILRIEHVVADLGQLAPLIYATGGNPKAMELALGCIKYDYRSLQQVIDDLHAARGELFDDLFARCWSLLDEAARRVLLAMPLFQGSASEAALATTSDVRQPMFQQAVERLTNLALLDAIRTDLHQPVRYSVHPLVRAFATAKLHETSEFEPPARERWVRWYIRLATAVSYCWDDAARLNLLDLEQATVHAVLNWCREHARHNDVVAMAKGVGYYYLVRGLWDMDLPCNLMHAEAARHLGDRAEEAQALSYHVHMLCRQGNGAGAAIHLAHLLELADAARFTGNIVFDIHHAVALHAAMHGDYAAAQQAWEQSLECGNEFTPNIAVVNRQWLADCLYTRGNIEGARVLLDETLADAQRLKMVRSQLFCRIRLAAIAVDNADYSAASALLADCEKLARETRDTEHFGATRLVTAQLYAARGDSRSARRAATDAIDQFQRLGLWRELEQARVQLAGLSDGVTSDLEAHQIQ